MLFPLPIPQILFKHKTVALIPSQRNHVMLRLGIPSPIKTLFVFLDTKNTQVLYGCLGILTPLLQIHGYVGHPV